MNPEMINVAEVECKSKSIEVTEIIGEGHTWLSIEEGPL
jgi:hypothetical protein